VLIVDDSPVSRKLVELPLSQKQYKLYFANTGQEATNLFEEHRPDLVILDWVMPDLSGEELCRAHSIKFARRLQLHHCTDWQHRQRLSCRSTGRGSRRPPDEAVPIAASSWRDVVCRYQDHRTPFGS